MILSGRFYGDKWIAPVLYVTIALFFTAQLVIITALGASFTGNNSSIQARLEGNTSTTSVSARNNQPRAPGHLSHKKNGTLESRSYAKTYCSTTSVRSQQVFPLLNNPTSWPPVENRLYPDMELYNQDGKLTRLSSLSGNVIIVQPVAMACPLSQAYSGANQKGKRAFGLCFPTIGVKSVGERMMECTGVSMKTPGLIYVQILLFNMQNKPVSIEDCRRWACHFDLRTSKNQYVLAATPKMTAASKMIIPGFHLVDRSFHLRSDNAGLLPKRSLSNHFFPTLQALFPVVNNATRNRTPNAGISEQ